MQERDLVLLPSFRSSGMTTPKVLKRFEYEASLMRLGVIAVDRAKPGSPALLFVRGAPNKVQGLVSDGTLPPDFHQVLLQQSSSQAELGAFCMPQSCSPYVMQMCSLLTAGSLRFLCNTILIITIAIII